ncbi:hypothetical protein PQE73_gp033 [Bacillus phage vB_BanS_MrDarsey]|uniref:Uncharacterized protein n=1 Tax=Bacillus phage vB_BanS_MrDarsey TaxID=2894787 RepID=A0AAE8YT60_9CAUD|nr:hypothetical protein PQE73_gp033 [Bacillus phage vB_BanS_MrDarsey]UGO47865.1 hypothetical protein MRDARSEY_33 [Bacillus phage vB_BanS_MrDarsey]
MIKMTVSQVWNKVNELQNGMETMAKALALGMTGDTPQAVIDGLLRDYKRFSNEYYEFMAQEVEVVEEKEDDVFVLQLKYDGSFCRNVVISTHDGEIVIQTTNNMKWAKKYTKDNVRDMEWDIERMVEEGYDVRKMKWVVE